MSNRVSKNPALLSVFAGLLSSGGRRRRAEKAQLGALLAAAPGEHCVLDADGRASPSPGLSALLGLMRVQDLADIQNRLEPDDASRLQAYMEELRYQGVPFTMDAQSQDGAKTLKIAGRRVDGRSVLWIEDITEERAERRRLEKALATGEAHLEEIRAALEILPHPAWIRDESQKITWCNAAYAQVINASPADIVAGGKELSPATVGKKKDGQDSRLIRREQARRACESGRPQIVETHIIVRGKRLLMRITETPLPGGHATLGLAENITAQEELEGELKRYQAANRDLLEQLRTAIAIYGADHKLEFYNSAFSQLWGLEEQWLNAKPKLGDIMEKLRENRRLPEQADFRRFKQSWLDMFTGLIEPRDDMLYLPDGGAMRMLVVPHAMGGLMMTFEDVTSRLELESSYNTLIAVQKETLDNLGEGVAVYGGDGRLKLWNPSFARLWQLNPEDLEGEPHINRIADKMKPRFEEEEWPQRREELVAAGLDRLMREGRLKRINQSLVDYTTVPLPDGGVLVTYSDVTDTVRVENALREKNAALEAAEQLKTDFLANVSYQLRTPLNAIMGFNEILDQEYFGPLNARQKEYTRDMKEAGERLLNLINDILDLSTIEAGYLNLQTEPVKIYDMLHNLVDLVGEWARKEKIAVTLSCPKNIGAVEADDRRLKQAVINLIRNSIAFTPAGGKIDITAKRRKDGIAITVADTGIGITAKDQRRVFEPFERGQCERLRAGSEERGAGRDTGQIGRFGAGLGLSLVKNIIELHGGRVELQSIPGQGTAVTLSIPFEQTIVKQSIVI